MAAFKDSFVVCNCQVLEGPWSCMTGIEERKGVPIFPRTNIETFYSFFQNRKFSCRVAQVFNHVFCAVSPSCASPSCADSRELERRLDVVRFPGYSEEENEGDGANGCEASIDAFSESGSDLSTREGK